MNIARELKQKNAAQFKLDASLTGDRVSLEVYKNTGTWLAGIAYYKSQNAFYVDMEQQSMRTWIYK